MSFQGTFHFWFEIGIFIGMKLLQVSRLGGLEAARVPPIIHCPSQHHNDHKTTPQASPFHMDSWDSNSGPQTCGASNSPTEMSISPSSIFLRIV